MLDKFLSSIQSSQSNACGGYLSCLYLAAADKGFLPYSGMMASNVVPDFDSTVRSRPRSSVVPLKYKSTSELTG